MDRIFESLGRQLLSEAASGLTGDALAAKVGSTQSFISRVLAGKRRPGRKLAAVIQHEFPTVTASSWDLPPVESAKNGTEHG